MMVNLGTINNKVETIISNVFKLANKGICLPNNDEVKVDFNQNKIIFKKPLLSEDVVEKKLLQLLEFEKGNTDKGNGG